uniref:Ribosomal protein L14 n=1 Tax=Babesia gibsoni TaxID=33632 RepID=A0A6M8NZR7_BABGI|nr:ribosomal protein L14 [Babesia gibsoni]
MININTLFSPSDNSGFKKAKCLGNINNIKSLKLNTICISVVKSCKKKSKFIKKSDIIKILITHTKLNNFNKYKNIKFYNNSAILLNKQSYNKYNQDEIINKNNLKNTSNIKLIGIIPSLIMNNLSKFKVNLKKAIFI